MSQTDKANHIGGQRTNPLITALVIGLGWGLVLGFIDGLPILLELPILPHLRVRLQALTYLIVWYEFVGAIFSGVLGLIVWGGLRLLGRDAGRRKLAAIYSGASVGLASLVVGLCSLSVPLNQLDDPGHVTLVLPMVGLGCVIGTMMGLVVYGGVSWWQGGWGFLRPLRWKLLATSVLAAFLISILPLLAIAGYRGFIRDSALFRSKSSGQAATPEQPNIVLITIDALRADHLGAYGYDPEISPNIDDMAKRGVVFDQAIAQSSWTGPSVASFVTSLYPSEMGIHFQRSLSVDLHVDEMRVTLAEALHDADYLTYAYSTNGHIVLNNGYGQGFDHFLGVRAQRFSFDNIALRDRAMIRVMCSDLAFRGQWPCKLFNWGYDQLFDPPLVSWQHNDLRITEYGKRFARLHKDERFFLWLYYVEPHTTYYPSQPFRPLSSEITPEREESLRSLGFWDLNGEEVIRPVDLPALVSLYDGEIADVDALVGEVLAEMEEQGLMDRTVIILNSDHGEEFHDHGDLTHGQSLYDELIRVPFIISGPTVEMPGRVVETQVSLLDLVPTVCEIVGVPIPTEASGRSLMPFLKGEEMEEVPAFSEVLHTSVFQTNAIRSNGYKLIYNVDQETAELYNLRADPHEQVDLADQEPEIVAQMLTDLETWMTQNARTAQELPRQRPLSQTLDDEMRQRLRDAGY